MEYFVITILVALSGVFSGLTLGLLGLNKTELERKIELGDKQAKKVYSVRKNGNLLLCTLLVGNVAVNTTLSIFLGSITSGILAGLIATALIVIIGEIIPQAVISRYALQFGSKAVWLVKACIVLLFPVCGPIAWTLNKTLGDEIPTVWSKAELQEIVKFHEDSKDSDLDADEERIMLGALSYSQKTAKDIMTPRTVVYGLESQTKLTQEKLEEIKSGAFTRIPVYTEKVDNIEGILYAKDLIGVSAGTAVAEIFEKDQFIKISEQQKLDDLLNKFIAQKIHIALVFDEYDGFEGVVTLEDVIEEILNIEIVDEDDTVADLQKAAKQKT